MTNCSRQIGRATLAVALLAGITVAHAGAVSYDTTGSTLACTPIHDPTHPLCTQNTPTSVTVGALTFTYYPSAGNNVATPSVVGLGKIVATGTGSNIDNTPALLTIKVNSTPPGASTALPLQILQGLMSTNTSAASLISNGGSSYAYTTPTFGTLPGAIVSGGTQLFTFQILNPTLALVAPAEGNPMGETPIQGAVSETSGVTLLPPTITHSFGASSVPMFGTASVTFTISNPNATPLSNLSFGDQLPYECYAPKSSLTSNCGGFVSNVGLGFYGGISLQRGSLAGGATCTVSANVNVAFPGLQVNSVTVSDGIAGTGNTSTATLMVLAPAPILTKSFADPVLTFHPATQLSFTVTNPSASTPVTLSGVGFTDNLPAGMVVSTPNHLLGDCNGGTITASPGSNVISLSGATLAATASCTFSVSVSVAAGHGTLVNTATPTANESGPGVPASATLVNNHYMLSLWR